MRRDTIGIHVEYYYADEMRIITLGKTCVS